MKSFDVRFWNVAIKKGRKRPYFLRWVVAGKVFPKSFTTRELADSFKADLIQAARRGEAFDTDTGLPESMMRATQSVAWYRHACDYVDDRWGSVSAKPAHLDRGSPHRSHSGAYHRPPRGAGPRRIADGVATVGL